MAMAAGAESAARSVAVDAADHADDDTHGNASDRHAPRTLRIAYVTETYPPEINGVSLTVARTVDWLRGRGHHVDLIRPRRADETAGAGVDGVTWRSAGAPIPLYPELRFGWAGRRALMRRMLASSAELVHVATPGPLAWSAVRAAAALGLPATLDFRTNFHQYSRHYRLSWLEPLLLAGLRRLHNAGRSTFVPTRALQTELTAAGFERVAVVARGIDTDRFAPSRRDAALRAAWGAGPSTPVLLHVGRLAAEKNVSLALAAYADARRSRPDVRMVVVGDGPAADALRRDHPDVHFAGTQRDAALAAHYASADVFLFPSLTDTWGNVTLEAMASGLPVVAFDVAAAAACVTHGVDGWLVPPDDAVAYRRAVADLLATPSPDGPWHAMGRAARGTAQHHGWDAVLRGFEAALVAVV